MAYDKDVHLLLLDQDGGGNGQRNIMYIHRSREEDEILFLYKITLTLIRECNAVRRTKS